MRKRFEIWADSFHEGDWACRELARAAQMSGAHHELRHERGFVPVHLIETNSWALELAVYGGYRSWSPVPRSIDDLLGWGKPDFIAYDPSSESIVFAVEETAAVPTGNQALQRCERLYGAARAKVPFWYLLSEYGLHKDGNVRRDSIYPTIMALKISLAWQVPVLVLHYSSLENPEDYTVGSGVASLFGSLLELLLSAGTGAPLSERLQCMLTQQYQSMMEFVASQTPRQTDFVPGVEHLSDPNLAQHLAALVCGRDVSRNDGSLATFLVWPTTDRLPRATRSAAEAKPLIKSDPFMLEVERDVGRGHAYCLTSNAGSRPQKREDLMVWLNQQRRIFDAAPALDPPAYLDFSIEQFPCSPTGLCHVITSRRIVFLYDHWRDLRNSLEKAFPRLASRLPSAGDAQPATLYVSNSVKPGRIFGDPYTGQMAAYAVAFGALDLQRRLFVAYFPHQVHAQVARVAGKASNKGLTLMRELTDLLVFAGGVAVNLSDGTTI